MFTAQQFVKAASLEEAYNLNQKKSSTVLGGGCWLKMGHRRIGTLIDLSGLGLDQIEETPEEWVLGAMVTLRQMETHPGLRKEYGSGFYDMTKHIVGVQFRNCATLGGSLASRFGFSDLLTWFLALDCEVELFKAGRIPLEQYAQMPYDRDILVRIYIKKNGRRAVYQSFRNTQTDLPVLTCAASCLQEEVRAVIGARPGRAVPVSAKVCLKNSESVEHWIEEVQNQLKFGSNMRASADYRKHLCGVLMGRALKQLGEV